MLGQFKRLGELVSSNVEALIDKATDPRKMLLLLRTEIEESILKLTEARSRASSRASKAARLAAQKAATADDWTAKAKLAMDKGREDLGRAALLAREGDRAAAQELAAEAETAKAEVAEIDAAIAELEAKRAETLAQLGAMPAPARSASGHSGNSGVADRQRSRIDEMEMRTAFVSDKEVPLDPAQVDEQLAELERDSAIDAELAAIRPAKGKRAKK